MGVAMSPSVVPSQLELVRTITLTGATQEFDFTGLSGDTWYMLTGSVLSAGAIIITLEINGDATATNYYSQYLQVSGAGVGAGRANNNRLIQSTAGDGTDFVIWIKKTSDDYAIAMSMCGYDNGASFLRKEYFVKTTAAVTNITQINLNSDTNLTAGDSVSLYRVKN